MPQESRQRVRTCIGCGTQSDKRALMRIVRMPDGTVCLDKTGKLAGRGAYVCSAPCFEQALKGKLKRALKCDVNDEAKAQIADELKSALEGALAR